MWHVEPRTANGPPVKIETNQRAKTPQGLFRQGQLTVRVWEAGCSTRSIISVGHGSEQGLVARHPSAVPFWATISCPQGVLTVRCLPSAQVISVPRWFIFNRSITNRPGGLLRILRTISPSRFRTVIVRPTTSTSQLVEGTRHSFSSMLRVSLPFASRKKALERNGPPVSSGGATESTASPLTLSRIPTRVPRSVPNKISGCSAPISSASNANPFGGRRDAEMLP